MSQAVDVGEATSQHRQRRRHCDWIASTHAVHYAVSVHANSHRYSSQSCKPAFMCQARFSFKRNRLRCVRCVNENRKKRKQLRLNGNRASASRLLINVGFSLTWMHK